MDKVHELEKKQFIDLFEQEQIDNIDKRLLILESFLETEKHLSIHDLSDLLAKRKIVLDIDFIEDTMKLLCQYGFAHEKKFDDGKSLFEHMHIGHHHDHLICTKCGEIKEFINPDMERLQLSIAANSGFHILQHKMEIYGICERCRKIRKRAPLMPLMLAKPGEKLIVREFTGNCKKMGSRLSSMGLRIGDVIEIITTQGLGQFVIAVGSKRFVVGKGMTRRILVEPQ